MEDGELTIENMIQLALCGLNSVIETVYGEEEVDDGGQLFFQSREQLASLLVRLNRGDIQPEYAEVELEKIQEAVDQWTRDNQPPPD